MLPTQCKMGVFIYVWLRIRLRHILQTFVLVVYPEMCSHPRHYLWQPHTVYTGFCIPGRTPIMRWVSPRRSLNILHQLPYNLQSIVIWWLLLLFVCLWIEGVYLVGDEYQLNVVRPNINDFCFTFKTPLSSPTLLFNEFAQRGVSFNIQSIPN